MKLVETPVFDTDGGIIFKQYLGPEEARTLLSFALNFLYRQGSMVTGLVPSATSYGHDAPKTYQ